MRIILLSVMLVLALGRAAGAQQTAAPAKQDSARPTKVTREHSRRQGLSIGGRAALGAAIPLLAIGIALTVLANVNDGMFLCVGTQCQRDAWADVGYVFTGVGAVALGGSIAMMVLSRNF